MVMHAWMEPIHEDVCRVGRKRWTSTMKIMSEQNYNMAHLKNVCMWSDLKSGSTHPWIHMEGPKKCSHPMTAYVCWTLKSWLHPLRCVHSGPICEDVSMVVQPVECTELQMMRRKSETHQWKYSIGTNLWRYTCVWWLVRPKKGAQTWKLKVWWDISQNSTHEYA